jgi:hypothetical protein
LVGVMGPVKMGEMFAKRRVSVGHSACVEAPRSLSK